MDARVRSVQGSKHDLRYVCVGIIALASLALLIYHASTHDGLNRALIDHTHVSFVEGLMLSTTA